MKKEKKKNLKFTCSGDTEQWKQEVGKRLKRAALTHQVINKGTFHSQFGERIFHLTGSGVPPEHMEAITISACIGEYSSTVISFENPTTENVVVDIVLAGTGVCFFFEWGKEFKLLGFP